MSAMNPVPEIDLVYLWVDGSDPKWRAKRNSLIGDTQSDSAVNCDGRYADNDELRYSLRSVARYAPWIRRIFIVTDNQIPKWLNTDNEKIKIVDHTEILPPESLPTFNSTVIEHCIYRIPGLAEHFLYANDDLFFNRPVSPADFFTPDGKPIIRFNRRPFRKLSILLKEKILHKPLSNYNLTILTAARLVEKRFGKFIGHKTHHNIDAYRKSLYKEVHDIFNDEIAAVMTNHVRSDSDIQRNIYSYVPAIKKTGKVKFVSSKESFRFHIDNPKHYAKFERLNPMLFCVNDSEYASDADRLRVKTFLERLFPIPSDFEKTHN